MAKNWYEETFGPKLDKLYSLYNGASELEKDKIVETISIIQSLIANVPNLNDFLTKYRKEKEIIYSNRSIIDEFSGTFAKTCTIPKGVNINVPKMSEKEMLELTGDFFGRSLDDELYKKFRGIYKKKEKYVSFGGNGFGQTSGEALFLPYFNEAYLRIKKENPIIDLSDLAHEFGHGIQFLTNFDRSIFEENRAFSEIVSIFFQILSLDYYKGIKGLETAATYESKFLYNLRLLRAKQITLLYGMFPEWESLENLSKKNMCREINGDLKSFERLFTYDETYDIESIIDLSLSQNIQYVFGTLVAIEIFIVYTQDKIAGLTLLKKIMSLDLKLSSDKYLEALKSLLGGDFSYLDEYEKVLEMGKSANF